MSESQQQQCCQAGVEPCWGLHKSPTSPLHAFQLVQPALQWCGLPGYGYCADAFSVRPSVCL
jgi:hypothetical protein